MPIPPDRSRALWRRQAVLTVLVAAGFGVVVLLSGAVRAVYDEAVARQRLSLPAANHLLLDVALVVAGVVLIALLGAVCVHAYRIATLTFRRGEENR